MECIKAIQDLEKYASLAKGLPKFALDVETFSRYGLFPKPIKYLLDPNNPDALEGETRLLQIGLDPEVLDRQYIFDVIKIGVKTLAPLIKPTLEKSILLGQNLKYDWGYLFVEFKIFARKLQDVMLTNQVIRSGDQLIKHDLIGLCRQYIDKDMFEAMTGMTFWEYEQFKKQFQTADWKQELTDNHLKYGAGDVIFPFYIQKAQNECIDRLVQKYNKPGVTKVVRMEWDSIPISSLKEIIGVGFDKDHHLLKVIPHNIEQRDSELAKVGEYFSREVVNKEYETYIDKTGKERRRCIKKWTTIEPISLRSKDQVVGALKDFCPGLEKQGSATPVLIWRLKEHPAISHIIKYRKFDKLVTTYGEKLFTHVHSDGRMHPDWFQIGQDGKAGKTVDTGRESCSKPNMMNQPPGLIRRNYVPREGYVYIDADYSNLEARLMAEFTRDKLLIQAFNTDGDPYGTTARYTLKLDFTPSKENGKEQRDFGKMTFLALNYQMGTKKYIDKICEQTEGELKMDFEEGKERRDLFFETYQGIKGAIQDARNKIDRIFETHESLVEFSNRKLIAIQFTFKGRPRQWMLIPKQEFKIKNAQADLKEARENNKLTYGQQEILRDDANKVLRTFNKEFKLQDPETGRWSTFGNEFGNRKSQVTREWFNSRIQGSAADLVKEAGLEIFNAFIKSKKFDLMTEGIIITVHDEIILEVKEENKDLAQEIMRSCMIEVGERYITKVPVKIEMGVGYSWDEVK